jgi:hypothetical protein
LQDYQIVSGFSDIKSELRTKSEIKKSLSEIRLWFSLEGDVLYVHDYDDHEKCIALAIQSSKGWVVFLGKGKSGFRLLEYVFSRVTFVQVPEELNEQYKLYGYFF